VRDPAKNNPMIEIRHERVARGAFRDDLVGAASV